MSDAVAERLTGAEEVKWNLADLYAGLDDPAIERDIEDANARADKLVEEYHGRVASLDAEEMFDLVQAYESIAETALKPGSFAQLLWSTQTENPKAGALLQKLTEEGSRLNQKLVFVELEWANAPDDHAQALLDHPVLQKYRHWLEQARRYRPHLLSEPEEKLLTEKAVTGREAWGRFFEETLGATRFELDGQQLPEAVVLSKLQSSDRGLRQRAAASLTAGLKPLSRTMAFVFNTLLADKASDDRLRRYPAWISSRNLSNEVDDGVVEALIGAVTSRYAMVARYYNLKKTLLGLDELFEYDRYAPLPAADRFYVWSEAKDIVLSAYGKFHARMAEVASMFFDKRWIDAAIAPGKQGGAYSHPVVPSVHPYILMNYEGTPREVMTLAHELGHGVHQWLGRDQGTLQANTTLITAETASVFGEMLVFQDLLSREAEPAAKLALLAKKIEDTLSTAFRQISLNRFEDLIHNARRSEGELSVDRFNELWMQSQRAMFGDSLTLTDNYSIWWSYIPHFVQVPGYVYAYSFGNLMVLALYARYQEQGGAFAEGYLDMLAAGGSRAPHELVKPLGVDLHDPAFWDHGLALVEKMVSEAEDLAASAV